MSDYVSKEIKWKVIEEDIRCQLLASVHVHIHGHGKQKYRYTHTQKEQSLEKGKNGSVVSLGDV